MCWQSPKGSTADITLTPWPLITKTDMRSAPHIIDSQQKRVFTIRLSVCLSVDGFRLCGWTKSEAKPTHITDPSMYLCNTNSLNGLVNGWTVEKDFGVLIVPIVYVFFRTIRNCQVRLGLRPRSLATIYGTSLTFGHILVFTYLVLPPSFLLYIHKATQLTKKWFLEMSDTILNKQIIISACK